MDILQFRFLGRFLLVLPCYAAITITPLPYHDVFLDQPEPPVQGTATFVDSQRGYTGTGTGDRNIGTGYILPGNIIQCCYSSGSGPPYGGNEPSYTGNRPPYSGNRPSYNGNEPSYGGNGVSSGGFHPGYNANGPNQDGSAPLPSGESYQGNAIDREVPGREYYPKFMPWLTSRNRRDECERRPGFTLGSDRSRDRTGFGQGPYDRTGDPAIQEMWLEITLVFLILAVIAYLDTRKPHNFPPGPSWLPVLGNLLHLKRLVQTTGFHHLAWERLSQQYGPVVGLKLGMTPPLILVSGHRAVTQTLNMEELDGRPDGFVFRFRTMGERRGVIFTDGEVWKEQRRFSLRNLREFGFGKRSMEALISEEARSLLMRLMEVGAAAGPEGVPMHLVFTLPVLNSLWSLTAGMRYSDEDAKLQQFINLLNEMTRSVDSTGGILNYLPSLRFLAPGLTGFDKFSSSQNKMWSFFMDIVKDHRETLSSDHARDLIDVFLQEMDLQKGEEGTSFTEAQLVALCKDLFAAGSETTSNTLSFAIMFMVLNPAVQARVHTELDEVVGRSRPPSLDDRNKLPFVSAVLMETQRMSNVGPVSLPHRALADTQIDGYSIPKDSTLLMSLWSCHMDPSHWGDPHNFRPDRFLNGKELLPADPWLLPFGTGRRRCLGETMARNSLFLFFTALLQNLTFSLPHGATPPCPQGVNGFTLNTQPYHAVIHSRR